MYVSVSVCVCVCVCVCVHIDNAGTPENLRCAQDERDPDSSKMKKKRDKESGAVAPEDAGGNSDGSNDEWDPDSEDLGAPARIHALSRQATREKERETDSETDGS
jgi:hypothetical protein